MNFVRNVQQFTYVSDMNGFNSTIDNFILSNSLFNYVNLLIIQMLEMMLIIIQITYQLL